MAVDFLRFRQSGGQTAVRASHETAKLALPFRRTISLHSLREPPPGVAPCALKEGSSPAFSLQARSPGRSHAAAAIRPDSAESRAGHRTARPRVHSLAAHRRADRAGRRHIGVNWRGPAQGRRFPVAIIPLGQSAYRQYEDVTKRFPSSEYDVLVVVESPHLLERKPLEKLRDLVTDLQLVPGARGVVSIYSARQPAENGGLPPPLFRRRCPRAPISANSSRA